MKIIYLIETPKGEKIAKETLQSLPVGANELIIEPNTLHEVTITDYDYAVVIPNGSILSENYLEILAVYAEEGAVTLPLVVLKNEKLTGVLNTCLYNANLAALVGELDHELALKQIDLTLYGALIPTSLLVKGNFKEGLKYYQHFYFLNKITKNEVPVIGVPKTLLTTSIDLTHEDADNEEKITNFKLAKEVE